MRRTVFALVFCAICVASYAQTLPASGLSISGSETTFTTTGPSSNLKGLWISVTNTYSTNNRRYLCTTNSVYHFPLDNPAATPTFLFAFNSFVPGNPGGEAAWCQFTWYGSYGLFSFSQAGGSARLWRFPTETPADRAAGDVLAFSTAMTSSAFTSTGRTYLGFADGKVLVYPSGPLSTSIYTFTSPTTTCAGRPCFQPAYVPGLIVIPATGTSYLPATGVVVFGTVSGRVIVLRIADDDPLQPTGFHAPAAAGSVTAIAHSNVGGAHQLYVSSEIGVVTVWDFENRRILGIAVLDFTGRHFAVDSTPSASSPVLYLVGGSNPATNIAKIARFNTRNALASFETFADANVTANGDFRFAAMRSTAPRIVLFRETATLYQFAFRTASVGTCHQYSCNQCGSSDADADYCGYCGRTSTCTVSSNCTQSGDVFSRLPPSCPLITGMSPNEGAVSGGTAVVFSGTGFFPSASQFTCIFPSVAPFQASAATPTSVTCTTPPGTGIGPAGLRFNGIPVAVAGSVDTTFEYYSCGNRDCATCSLRPECTWCARQGACTGTSACTAGARLSSCPRVLDITPKFAAFNVSTEVTITVENLDVDVAAGPSAATYQCGWTGFSSTKTAATVVAGTNRVTCQTPIGIAANSSVTPELFVASNILFSRGTAVTTARVDMYNCGSFAACFTCLTNHPQCRFCSSGTCVFSTSTCPGSIDPSGCPRVSDVTPDVLHTTADASLLSISMFVSSPVTSPQCQWTTPTGTANALVAPVSSNTNSTGTNVRCPLPSGSPIAVGTWLITVYEGTTILTNPGSVRVYDCSGAVCSACVSPLRPKCGWCLNTASGTTPGCNLETVCPPERRVTPSNGLSCPTISLTKLQDTLSGTTRVGITFSTDQQLQEANPNQLADARCNFVNATRSINSVVTVQKDATGFFCTSPSVTSIGLVDVSVTVNSVSYAPAVPFEYYDCVFAAPGVKRDCASCTSGVYTDCGWCRGECGASSTCPVTALNTCPAIVSVTPNFTETTASSFVSVKTNIPAVPADQYNCIFDNGATSLGVAQGDSVICPTPLGQTAGVKSVRLAVADVGNWAPDSSGQIEFYSCPRGFEQCSSTCWFVNPRCGWCLNSAQCSGPNECSSSEPNAVWLNSTNGCPIVRQALPNHIQVAKQDRPIIVEEISFSIDNLPLLSINNTAKRALFAMSDFQCAYGSRKTNVTRVEPTATGATFYCNAPTLFNQGFYTVQIEYKGRPVNAGGEEFQVQDCLRITRCGLCILSPNCGWCRGAVSCMTKAWCDAEPFPFWGSECPVIRGPRPATVNVGGGELVSITGGRFVNSSDLVVVVGEKSYNATFVSETEISFTTLPSSVGSASVTVLLNGVLYHDPADNLTLTFVEPSSNIVTTNVPAIAASVVVAALALIGMAIALFIMKTRKVGFFAAFKLKEPNYNEVAFGAFLTAQYKFPKDNYDLLAMKLLAKDPSFVFSMLATTAATEQDAVAKSLTFFFEHRKRSVEYLVLFISDEVKRNKTENTIFRNNSMASKMFKFFSKVVGVKYLFHTLARFIVELNSLSEMKKDKNGSNETSKSLLSMEMEVDPTKYGEDAMVDSDANVLQLQFACQKVFSVIKSSLKDAPPEFIQVFQSMREAIINKFQSEDAILKAVGGFLFLRFICPALTAPHAYGLLQAPPNPACQRQLILIGKIIQNLANLTMPGAKETFMLQLNDFFTRNIPKMKQYYSDLLSLNATGMPPTEICSVTEVVANNSLASLWGQIHANVAKLRKQFDEESDGDNQKKAALNADLSELMEAYPKPPRKATAKDDKKDEK